MERVNPAATEEGVPAELVALQAAYALAEKGNEGVAALLTVALCGGVCVSTHRGLAQFASYNATCKCSAPSTILRLTKMVHRRAGRCRPHAADARSSRACVPGDAFGQPLHAA